jgi:hypothetical protein
MKIHYPVVIMSALCGYALLILWGTWNGPLDLPEARREVVSSMHEKAEGSATAQTFSAAAANEKDVPVMEHNLSNKAPPRGSLRPATCAIQDRGRASSLFHEVIQLQIF